MTDPAQDDETAAVILDVLKRAAEAHGVYESTALGGVYDEQWPEWYTQHMVKTLAEEGYRLVKSA